MAIPTQEYHGIALAAGAGGLELGISLAIPRYRTVCWCEQDAYAAAALVARMEDAALDDAPVWSDLGTFDGKPWRGKVDIVTAGYPCQPFSQAGKRLGDKDPRHLWPHVRRVLEETGAPLLFIENVTGHVTLGLEAVRRDLLGMGYGLEAGIFSAAEIGASHLRQRLFLLAYTACGHIGDLAEYVHTQWHPDVYGGEIPVRDISGLDHLDGAVPDGYGRGAGLFPPGPGDFAAWERRLHVRPDLQPAVAGSDDGLAFKVDRYRLAGNGVCSLAAAYAFCSLLFAAIKEA